MATTPTLCLFVSHSHEDDAFCQRLIADLRTHLGEDAVWYDASGGLHGSDDWWDRIVAEITERPYFLVVLSPAASASNWVPQEMKIAFRQHVELGKRLLPVRLAPSPRRPDWESIQEFDFQHSDDPQRYAAALAEVFRSLGMDPSTAIAAMPVTSREIDRPMPSSRPQPLSGNERLAQEVHTAYGREHWSDVLDKTELLMERSAMTPTLWRERASAAYALGDAQTGLAAVEKAQQADPDDQDTQLLRARLLAKTGEDAQAVDLFTRAFALTPLDAIATRLLILDDLTGALGRLGRWEDVIRRARDAHRIAPGDSRWVTRQLEAQLATGSFEEVLAWAKNMPHGVDLAPLLPAWGAAVGAAAQAENMLARDQLLRVALAVGIDQGVVETWRRANPWFASLVTLSGHGSDVRSVAWAPDGTRLATGSGDSTAKIWEVASGKLLATLSGHSGTVTSVAWSPDGTRLATGSDDKTARILDVASAQLLTTLLGHSSAVTSVAWAPDGTRLATGSGDSTAKIWEVASGKLLATLSGHQYRVNSVAWSLDGTRLATGSSDSTARIWEVASARNLRALSGPSGTVTSVAWAPDGTRLVIGSYDNTARIQEAWSGKLLATLSGHTELVNSVAWSLDGTRLATGSNDSTARIWEVASARNLTTLSGHSRYVNSVAWSPDGTQLATGSGDFIAKVWSEA